MSNNQSEPLDPHAQQLLSDATEVRNRAIERYYEWVKQMLSLSFAALTALVALQKNYTPDSDLAQYLLWGTFVSMAASVACAAIDLRSAGQGLLAQSLQMAEDAQKPLENRRSMFEGRPPLLGRIASNALPWLLALSVLCLSSFAIVNSM